MNPLIAFAEKFTHLTEDQKNVILKSNSKLTYKKNQLIASLSKEHNNSYFVLKGCVGVFCMHEEKTTVSDFFIEGEPVLIGQANKHLHREIRSLEETEIAISTEDEVERLVNSFPAFQKICLAFAEERLQKSMSFSEDMKMLTPLKRYKLLLEERPELIDRLPQHLIAMYIGVTPEALSRLKNARA